MNDVLGLRTVAARVDGDDRRRAVVARRDYAVMSFIVARRTREIGVRVALGASRMGVVGAIFRRPLIQVGFGILVGAVLIVAGGNLETEMPGMTGGLSLRDVALIAAYATLMLGVCLPACVVPTRRALGVEPTIALRLD